MLDLEALCENCHHAYKFHFTSAGDPMTCDEEVFYDHGDDAEFFDTPGAESTAVLCGCPQFVLVTETDYGCR